ncbi:hypothetical protein FCM35_KLT07907 [Carex littledalei]|uniref:Uncharacterized protein n=1 Tax=Carex littledalei TaxID=544730 RepID=A0A833V6H0_9POAL|nr:hypothetical protein FCM35_KLT07907 [Carex littledalei]
MNLFGGASTDIYGQGKECITVAAIHIYALSYKEAAEKKENVGPTWQSTANLTFTFHQETLTLIADSRAFDRHSPRKFLSIEVCAARSSSHKLRGRGTNLNG